MIRQTLTLLVLLLWAVTASAEPKDAVVRITSHGCSGTVVQTGPGRTLILTCAHGWNSAKDMATPIVIDAPAPSPGAISRGTRPRVIAIDHHGDVALIEMGVGPLPYVCSIAPRGESAKACLSVGYDEMRWPATVRRATVWSTSSGITWTAEKPWHGRSGGALINEKGHLVGVVSGYEMGGSGRGMYASHGVILKFLTRDAPVQAQVQGRTPGCNGGICPSPGCGCPGGCVCPSPPRTYEIRSPR